MRKPALVTGSTGIVGSHIVRALLDAGQRVCVLVRANSDRRALAGLDVEVRVGDVLDPASVQDAAAGCGWVFHAAAVFAYAGVSTDAQTELAVQGTRNVLQAARRAGARRVIVTSSSVTLGSTATPQVLDESRPVVDRDPAPYVASKIQQEAAAFDAGRRLGIEVVAICPTLVLGAHDYRLGPSNANLANYLNDPFRSTFIGGCNVVSARDIGVAHVIAARRGEPGLAYVAGGENLRWRALHALVSELAGTFGPSVELNHTAAYLAGAALEAAAHLAGRRPLATRDEARMACRFYWYSSARLEQLGWSARPARQAVAEGLAWVLGRGHVSDTAMAQLKLVPEIEAMVRCA